MTGTELSHLHPDGKTVAQRDSVIGSAYVASPWDWMILVSSSSN